MEGMAEWILIISNIHGNRKKKNNIREMAGCVLMTLLFWLGAGILCGCGDSHMGKACDNFAEADSLAREDEQALLEAISPAVVRIEAGKLFGSGIIFAINQKEILIITNRHLIEGGAPDVIFWDGMQAKAETFGYSESCDLGFLRVSLADSEDLKGERYRRVRYDETAFRQLKAGDELFILGSADYPAGNLFYGTIGNCSIYMEDFGMDMLWAYCEVKPGMSGSGVFDRRGNLIGMVCGGNEEKEAAALPLDKILEEWQTETE